MDNDKFKGLDVLVKEDGVYLSFESPESSAMINLSALADVRSDVTGAAIKAWCEEARRSSEAAEARRLLAL